MPYCVEEKFSGYVVSAALFQPSNLQSVKNREMKAPRLNMKLGIYFESPKGSKYIFNIGGTLGYRLVCHFFVLTTF